MLHVLHVILTSISYVFIECLPQREKLYHEFTKLSLQSLLFTILWGLDKWQRDFS